ncbi:unnamed protein product [Phyllotreta striolata]|uniref:Nucleolar protein 14 n=1 Tax=Phyllotreta striolata TaxID=444603 RepID=A0A9N9TTW3_PHYSR|nr:unnamed protein product [Phyllotreta striolata]
MAKTKNKKGTSSDQVHKKKEEKKMNPFEVHVNKEKFKVLGKKQKTDMGLPGISRAKAIQKRKSTLLQEYKVQNKSNKFLDKRIGERGMDDDERATARFATLKMKSYTKKSIFNLADDEVLTHKGQTLSEIEKFDDPKSDDEFDIDDKNGNLDTNFVEEAHFGGGLLKNTGKDGSMTHKDLINQLIIESKKRKAEKQKTKEATLELTEKLDSEWKDLIPLVTKSNANQPEPEKKPEVNDYDKLMRELKFEKRGTVSDRLKTEEELAKEEKETLEKLEEERLQRMNKDDKTTTQINHRSADDLDDNFVYSDDNDEDNMLSYNNEGESNLKIEAQVNGNTLKPSTDDSINEEQVAEEEQSESEEEELETDSEDNLSDLKESEEESDDEDVVEKTETKYDHKEEVEDESKDSSEATEVKFGSKQSKEAIREVKDLIKQSREFRENVETKEAETKEVENPDIPFTFTIPDSYENLVKILEEHENHQNIVIERMIKCNHPSLSEQNKGKLGLLFAYLLQYLNDLFSDCPEKDVLKKHFELFQQLAPHIYALAQINSENAHSSTLEVIKEKFEEFRKKPKKYPDLEILVFLKLVSILFPTSDFRHKIVTPCYVFMEIMLTKCRVRSRRDISYGLFIVTLLLEYSLLSKRYLPAAINYLAGLLHMMVPKTGVKLLKIPPPFKSTSSLLVLVENCSLDAADSLKLSSIDLVEDEITPDYQIRALHNVVKLSQQFWENFKEMPSNVEVFEKISNYLALVPLVNYPKTVQDGVNCFLDDLKRYKNGRKLHYLVLDASRPKALRLYEPKVQVIYDVKQHKVQSREKAEISKLMHKVKKERKGALREIRKDNSFLSRIKINQRLESDKIRMEKTKRIYSEAAIQQSEFNSISRKKKKKQ